MSPKQRGLVGPTKQKVTGLFLSQGTTKVADLIPGWGPSRRQLIDVSPSNRCFSLSLFLSLPLFLKSMKIYSRLRILKKLEMNKDKVKMRKLTSEQSAFIPPYQILS